MILKVILVLVALAILIGLTIAKIFGAGISDGRDNDGKH